MLTALLMVFYGLGALATIKTTVAVWQAGQGRPIWLLLLPASWIGQIALTLPYGVDTLPAWFSYVAPAGAGIFLLVTCAGLALSRDREHLVGGCVAINAPFLGHRLYRHDDVG